MSNSAFQSKPKKYKREERSEMRRELSEYIYSESKINDDQLFSHKRDTIESEKRKTKLRLDKFT